MSAEHASSIQKVDSDDSIVACQQDATDFFNSIGQELSSGLFAYEVDRRRVKPGVLGCQSGRFRNTQRTQSFAADGKTIRGAAILRDANGRQVMTCRL